MRKVLICLALALIFISCQKESPLSVDDDLQLTTKSINNRSQLVKKTRDYSVVFETWATPEHGTTLYNQCYPENVYFTGPIPYHIQYLQYGTEYYISYDVDFSNFTGTGETSGLKYSINRRSYKGIIPDSLEAVEGATLLGRQSVQVTYKTAINNTLKVTENIFFYLTKDAHIYAWFTETAGGCK